ncbi:hypothetical protein J437_LFUL001695 [Ladona fulva]|uniref:MADF domain-containing protein n=1 Tax=Ladona fulva TaxID=123851 RepID=A0A8K0NYW2_LADFU|nr:hypothetical protein J437_LFUL001695 [Ladona fulva]
MEWTNEVTMEFIDLYEGEPSIWNPQNPDHKDGNKTYDAWKHIQASISVECSMKELKKKKENLMVTYRKLAQKVKNSMKTGTRAKEAYKPEWFAYQKMASFLHSIYIPRKTKTSDAIDTSYCSLPMQICRVLATCTPSSGQMKNPANKLQISLATSPGFLANFLMGKKDVTPLGSFLQDPGIVSPSTSASKVPGV